MDHGAHLGQVIVDGQVHANLAREFLRALQDTVRLIQHGYLLGPDVIAIQ